MLRFYFLKCQANYLLSAFSKDELRFTFPVLLGVGGWGGGDSDAASINISRISDFIEANRTLKSILRALSWAWRPVPSSVLYRLCIRIQEGDDGGLCPGHGGLSPPPVLYRLYIRKVMLVGSILGMAACPLPPYFTACVSGR